MLNIQGHAWLEGIRTYVGFSEKEDDCIHNPLELYSGH